MIIDEDVYLVHVHGRGTSFLNEGEHILEHFGVLGMKWGVRNDKKSRRERNALKYETKAELLTIKINELSNKRTKGGGRSRRTNEKILRLDEKRRQARSDAEAKRQGKLSKGQKKVAVGAGAAAAIIAAYGSYSMAQSGEFRRLGAKGKAFITGKTPSWKSNPALADKSLDANGIFEKVVKQINPNYGEFGTKMNCRRATFAYEMRRRGHDVVATRTSNGRGQDISGIYNVLHPHADLVHPGRGGVATRTLSEMFKKKIGRGETPFLDRATKMSFMGRNRIDLSAGRWDSRIFSAIAKHPNGSRGELGVKWGVGGGHSMVWEIINGKPVIFDAQSGKKFTSTASFLKQFQDAGIADAAITRLDNVPLNEDFLLRWLR